MEECDHLAQLAEDLLVVARTSAGELAMRLDQLELRELLGRVRRRFADRARERGRSIRVDAEEGQLIYADELRLRPRRSRHTRDGTGLGLSIFRAIAEAHGGRAELVPGAGGGCGSGSLIVPLPAQGHLRLAA